ncbi:metal ABC transporter solute-binding protein, Zn/Mn family [Fundidesulfovibrio agrisoli]|uniref:metal ABC transporter solute-binding protein, Zn/Mn family n=1 Tax=Fundidesulfovibrio agrisoli TaxID=2922717 RepID=UPI001FAC5808|nr:zinc ABC transporter substrate-binding protein [Fundidesulfovibrio agrisoli]
MIRAFVGILVLLACVLLGVAAQAAPLEVAVSVAPQKYFIQKLAGPLARVSVMVSPGADPHSFEPKASQMAQVAGARLYFAQGVEFEQVWLPRMAASNKGLTVVDATAGIDLLPLEEHGHDKEAGHQHAAGSDKETDPHTWTSPRLAKLEAANMARALAQADPANAQAYEANLAALSQEIDALDASIREALQGLPEGASFLVFHPAWAYFAREYGLREVGIEVGGKEPGPRLLRKIIDESRKKGVKVVFVQPQFSRKAAQSVAEGIGATLAVADDLAEDWAANLLQVAKAFREAAR